MPPPRCSRCAAVGGGAVTSPTMKPAFSALRQLRPEVWAAWGRAAALPVVQVRVPRSEERRRPAAAPGGGAGAGSGLLSALAAREAALPGAAQTAQTAQAAQGEQQAPGHLLHEDDALRLLQRVVYPQCKAGLRSASLTVRQEHLALLRGLVGAFPGRFADLARLTFARPGARLFSSTWRTCRCTAAGAR
ncbi:MAG: hypothetical protein J3K34DRAFT_273903 [Monoraphidium minutum]|nr:MAG: hypothetical protein J3K34DRAFT_273903 [Monoraphidium minutum]